MDSSLDALGQVIREHRVANGLTQDELGTDAGYGAGAGVSISRIENGLTRPTRDRFAGIAVALGFTPDELEAAARERTRDISAQGANGGGVPSSAGRERPGVRAKRLSQAVERREAVSGELSEAFKDAHDRARDEFFMTLVGISGGIDGAPQPDPVKPDDGDDDVTYAEAEASFRFRFASRGIANVLAGGAQLAEAGAAPEAGRLASYGAFQTVLAMGRASTGRKISDLHGAAADRAARAKFGLGPKASGGFGIAGGDRVLTGIRWSTTLALHAMAMRSELKKQAELDKIDDEIRATQRGFEALEDILPRATEVLDHIAVHGTRALKRWDAQMVTRPCQWDSLDSAQQQRFLDFVEISACQLAVASIDVEELMDSRGDDRERLIAWADAVLSKSQEDVEALV